MKTASASTSTRMLSTSTSATLIGIDGYPASVDVHVQDGPPSFTIVGRTSSSDRAVRDRIRAAVLSSGLEWPHREVRVSVSPSGRHRVTTSMDLAIAVAFLAATGQVPAESLQGRAFLGELDLDGSIRAVVGMLPLTEALSDREIVVAPDAYQLATAARPREVRAARTLGQLASVLAGSSTWPDPPTCQMQSADTPAPDLSDVIGHPPARRAIEVAAAGGHHLLMIGPPGASKTMLSRRLVGLLPDLDREQAVEATRVRSAAGLPLPTGLATRPMLRSPHHTATAAAIHGGGTSAMRPGEVSLAHHGVLFLDELSEFAPSVLDALRQPLDEGAVRVSRGNGTCTIPAKFLLVATMRPCPCGQTAGPDTCRCSDHARQRYLGRLAGPLLDRFDLRVHMQRPDPIRQHDIVGCESTETVAARVAVARARAADRGVATNAELTNEQLDRYAPLTPASRKELRRHLQEGLLSTRGLRRVRCVALTLCDLSNDDPELDGERLDEAMVLRAAISKPVPAANETAINA